MKRSLEAPSRPHVRVRGCHVTEPDKVPDTELLAVVDVDLAHGRVVLPPRHLETRRVCVPRTMYFEVACYDLAVRELDVASVVRDVPSGTQDGRWRSCDEHHGNAELVFAL